MMRPGGGPWGPSPDSPLVSLSGVVLWEEDLSGGINVRELGSGWERGPRAGVGREKSSHSVSEVRRERWGRGAQELHEPPGIPTPPQWLLGAQTRGFALQCPRVPGALRTQASDSAGLGPPENLHHPQVPSVC